MSNRQFGTPENNNVKGVAELFQTAVQNGYLQQLQAYGIGKGMSYQEAVKYMLDGDTMPLYIQESEAFNKLLTAQNKVVSTGDYNVKGEESPASYEVPPETPVIAPGAEQ